MLRSATHYESPATSEGSLLQNADGSTITQSHQVRCRVSLVA
jgi:hypothetical protein